MQKQRSLASDALPSSLFFRKLIEEDGKETGKQMTEREKGKK